MHSTPINYQPPASTIHSPSHAIQPLAAVARELALGLRSHLEENKEFRTQWVKPQRYQGIINISITNSHAVPASGILWI